MAPSGVYEHTSDVFSGCCSPKIILMVFRLLFPEDNIDVPVMNVSLTWDPL